MTFRYLFLLLVPVLAAAQSNRYIVELDGEPVATRLARGSRRVDFTSVEARREREAVRAAQRRTRSQIENRGRVLASVDTVANAFLMEMSAADAQAVERTAGVKSVRPARQFRLMLDRALPLHRVPEAWSMVGAGNAGAGVKIGIIDTGIDVSHAAFQDPSLSVPDGYPRVNQDSDEEFTNSKVIVARSYTSLLRRRDPDQSARDRIGHGTATAMAAAGGRVAAPLAIIGGVAPRAWLGSYKVFGSPGTNELASEEAVIKAIDDAVADGMDVINLSLGSDLAGVLDEDAEVQALERAARAGIIVVVAAGNNGSDPTTISSPATAPSAIAVGASASDRIFSGSLTVDGLGSFAAVPGSSSGEATSVSAPLFDVAALDQNGLACSGFPQDSLTGRIAVILRGECLFEEKLGNAQAAGAVAALIYTDAARPEAITMSAGAARLPGSMVSYGDGVRIKERLASGSVAATLSFALAPFIVHGERLGGFSASGPGVDLAIKPELVAVGTSFYTAAQKLDSEGALFSNSGFVIEQGTSFSAPVVAGAAAVLRSARPGLTAAQYRSLLINTAVPAYSRPGVFGTVQQAGAGALDLSAALRTTVAASPAALSFGAAGPDPSVTRTLTITNLGMTRETFQISPSASTGGPVPQMRSTVDLPPGFAVDLPVTFRGASLGAGQYEGFLYIQGLQSGTVIRVPYWYAVADAQPRLITVLQSRTDVRRGATVNDAVIFRITDAAGLPVLNFVPEVTVVSGGGEVLDVVSRSRISPGAFSIHLRMGPRDSSNRFRIQAGSVAKEITLTAP